MEEPVSEPPQPVKSAAPVKRRISKRELVRMLLIKALFQPFSKNYASLKLLLGWPLMPRVVAGGEEIPLIILHL
jgi:hypothetical protein